MAKANFEACLLRVLVHEGGYVNHPADPGGATNKGITQAVYDAWRAGGGQNRQTVKLITDDEVKGIYRARYWAEVRGDDLPAGLDFAVFDLAVNSGVNRAARYLQRVAGAAEDGKIGPATLAAVAHLPARGAIRQLCALRLAFLQQLKTWATFGKGWGRRVAEVETQALNMAK